MTVSPSMSGGHPDLAPQQAPADPEPTAPTASDGESPSPDDGLIFGKYKTMEEAQRAYFEQANSLSRINDTVQQLAARQALTEQMLTQPQASPGPSRSALDDLADFAIPPEKLERAIIEVAERVSERKFNEKMSPITEGIRARSAVTSRYPEFGKREQEISDFLQTDPTLSARYNRIFATDPQAAMEWAYGIHRESRPAPSRTRASAAAPSTETQMPRGAATQQTRGAQGDSYQQELEAALDKYRRTGDMRELVKVRLRDVIPEEHTR